MIPNSVFQPNLNNFTENITPPDKRVYGLLGWIYSLIYPIQWRLNINFITYWLGSNDAAYSISTTYTKGQRVIFFNQDGGSYYGDNAVYEANTSIPINTPPTLVNQVDNSGNGFWIPVQPNFIGSAYRQSFTCNKLIFEYALNSWFHTTFRQPIIGRSDIYITQNNVSYNQFFSTPDSQVSFDTTSTVTPVNNPPITKFSFPSYNFSPLNNFTIFIPNTVFNNLSPIPTLRNGIIRSFADKICPAGAIYNIAQY